MSAITRQHVPEKTTVCLFARTCWNFVTASSPCGTSATLPHVNETYDGWYDKGFFGTHRYLEKHQIKQTRQRIYEDNHEMKIQQFESLERENHLLKVQKEILELDNSNLNDSKKTSQIEIMRLQSKLSKMEANITKKDDRILELENTLKELMFRYKESENRSKEITKEMAQRTANSGVFESGSDEYSNTNIADRFYKLYGNEWAKLSRLLGKTLLKDVEEINRLRLLSDLVKKVYDECTQISEQRNSCLFLMEAEELESPAKRRCFCQREDVRLKVKEKVLETVFSSKEAIQLRSEENKGNVKNKLEDFFGKVSDCCWQVVAMSNPPMMLNFNVVGKPFETVEMFWTKYATKKSVQDMSLTKGTIALVVWPSVVLKDESKCYKKGDAVVVNIGKDTMTDFNGESEN